ncbi:PD-(D/E)XK nuclease family protein [Halobacteriovorax sp. JY17]|uniref:PD-(D/E)XK nuclease family protein n=1 Tax=Halobacteriovorax sp. JY17 TaxID=2014617 RepID=UPI000C669D52|nr:PD-(D/E)XK nuclease family protein [Halobacteriovorax sp. JY17]PIK14599.1 MAG: hypothetical protein CES88_09680 [Halobacteriovorax sp. JY17]
MLSVYLYENSTEIYNLEPLGNSEEKVVVICPHPMAADSLRSRISDPSRAEVITISKFSSDLLNKIDEEIILKRKADLLGQLATIWKKKLSDYAADSFFDSFNLFTELRGYSLDFEMIKEVLPSYDEAIQKSLPIYWMYFEQLGIVDEHKANEILSHHLKIGISEEVETTYLFWGFNHINSGQIDFINSLAIRNKVIIPFPKEVFKQTRPGDWIRWFKADELREELTEFKRDVKSYFFPKKRLAQKLKEILDVEEVEQIVLAEKKVTLDSCLEVSVLPTHFRTTADLFSAYTKRAIDEIESVVGEGIECEELISCVKSKVAFELSKNIEEKNFRLIKVYSSLLKIITDYKALSDDNEFIKFYDVQVVREIISLNLPRDYFAPISNLEKKISILGLNELESSEDVESIFLLTDAYQGVKKGGSKYQEDIMKFLSSLGPIQRPELEFLMVREKFRELLDKGKIIFCIQEGLVESDRSWSEFFRGVEFLREEIFTPKVETFRNVLETEGRSFDQKVSASKLQTYIDCPKKFFYTYLERKEIDASNSKDLRPNEIGSLEHEVIEKYFDKVRNWDEGVLRETVSEVYKKFVEENRKLLSEVKEKISLYEIYNYSENGVKYILNILENMVGSEVSFEAFLADKEFVSGRIDCIIKFEDKFIILDFKRSGFSIPSKGEIEKYSKIQLPFYLKHFGGEIQDVLFWGFVNLSNTEESLLIHGGHELGKDFMERVGLGVKTRKSAFDDLNLWFSEYCEFEDEVIEELKKETLWRANPSKDDVCTFCSVSNLCTRGSV